MDGIRRQTDFARCNWTSVGSAYERHRNEAWPWLWLGYWRYAMQLPAWHQRSTACAEVARLDAYSIAAGGPGDGQGSLAKAAHRQGRRGWSGAVIKSLVEHRARPLPRALCIYRWCRPWIMEQAFDPGPEPGVPSPLPVSGRISSPMLCSFSEAYLHYLACIRPTVKHVQVDGVSLCSAESRSELDGVMT